MAGMATVGKTGDQQSTTRLLKMEQAAKPRMLYGVGSTMPRLSDCTK